LQVRGSPPLKPRECTAPYKERQEIDRDVQTPLLHGFSSLGSRPCLRAMGRLRCPTDVLQQSCSFPVSYLRLRSRACVNTTPWRLDALSLRGWRRTIPFSPPTPHCPWVAAELLQPHTSLCLSGLEPCT